jgi:hypothetical protein
MLLLLALLTLRLGPVLHAAVYQHPAAAAAAAAAPCIPPAPLLPPLLLDLQHPKVLHHH